MLIRLFRHFFLIALLFAAFIPTVSQGQPEKDEEDKGNIEDSFQARIKNYYEAWNTLDTEKAGIFYAKDADLVFYDISPLKYTGWDAYKTGVKKLLEPYTSFRLVPADDLKISRRGKIVWTTIGCHFSGVLKDGTKAELDGRHTAIWEKQKGEWLIVHEHVSVPLAASPASSTK